MTNRLLDAHEVAERLNVPVTWVRESTRSGVMVELHGVVHAAPIGGDHDDAVRLCRALLHGGRKRYRPVAFSAKLTRRL
jgi:hypothetical protein